MAIQLTNMLGSTLSDRIRIRLGENRVFSGAPLIIVVSLVLLAALQIAPALVFIGLIGFVTAVVHPILLNRIQTEVPDDIRATLLSVQSLMFTGLFALSEPILGLLADKSGLPTAYLILAGSMGILSLFLLWKSRCHLITVTTNADALCEESTIPAVA
ncbi:MAG: MFS transporter [Anaerolineae bacterium]|nr:MFS transporter [Anaerolineae bacterium]